MALTGIDLPETAKRLKGFFSSFIEEPFLSHPFLIVLLFLLSVIEDSYKVIPWPGFITTSLTALIIAFFMLFIISYLIRNKRKAALITSVFLYIIFFYADIKNFIFHSGIIPNLIERRNTFVMMVLIFFYTIFCLYVFFSRQPLKKLNLYLTILFAIMIPIKIGQINMIAQLTDGDYRNYFAYKKVYPLNHENSGKNPDIYYIILDSYTSSKSLKDYWQYDNESFVTFLRQKGFFVAEDSLSPNRNTPLSIAQSLNVSSFNESIYKLPEGIILSLLYDMFQNNKVTASLKAIGYTFHNLSHYDVAGAPRFYTIPEVELPSWERPFPKALFEKTIFGLLRKRHLAATKEFSKINLAIFERLKSLSNQKYNKPIFVYAHIMMPHFPYHFDRKGHYTPIEKLRGTLKRKDLYLEQLIYTNQLVMETINSLWLSYPQKPPIIILQGDHGFRYLEGSDKEGSDKERENWTILNAYFLPNKKCDLTNDISPLNTFRVIFNCYFGTKYNIITE